MSDSRKKIYLFALVFLSLFFLTALITFEIPRRAINKIPVLRVFDTRTPDLTREDVYFSWLEGVRIAGGDNPYSRIHNGDMRNNQKYATYFPLFYEFSYLTNLAGFDEFEDWTSVWRVIFFIFNCGIALLIFYPFYKKEWYLAGVFGAMFWLFNRWTLYVVSIVHLEFFTIFFFVLSIMIFHKNKKVGALAYGFSLALKQIGIFAAPLFLIWTWQSERDKPIKKTLEIGLLIGSIPLLSSIPFLFWDLSGFIKSVFFSATRSPRSNVGAYSFDTYVNLVGIPAKIPLLFFLLVIFWFVWRKKIGKYMAVFLTMLVFVEFNSVFYNQYMVWIMSFIPLVLFEYMEAWQDKQEILADVPSAPSA